MTCRLNHAHRCPSPPASRQLAPGSPGAHHCARRPRRGNRRRTAVSPGPGPPLRERFLRVYSSTFRGSCGRTCRSVAARTQPQIAQQATDRVAQFNPQFPRNQRAQGIERPHTESELKSVAGCPGSPRPLDRFHCHWRTPPRPPAANPSSAHSSRPTDTGSASRKPCVRESGGRCGPLSGQVPSESQSPERPLSLLIWQPVPVPIGQLYRLRILMRRLITCRET